MPWGGEGGGSSGVKEKNVDPSLKQLNRSDQTFMPRSTVYESATLMNSCVLEAKYDTKHWVRHC